MTANKAKEFLLKHFQFLKEMWKPHPDYNVLEAIKFAISAIEKQIPKRPIDFFNGDEWIGVMKNE